MYVIEAALRRLNEVRNHEIDHTTNNLVHQPTLAEIRIKCSHNVVFAPEESHVAQISNVDEAGSDAIIAIVIIVSNLIGKIGKLRFKAWLLTPDEALSELAKSARIAHRAVL